MNLEKLIEGLNVSEIRGTLDKEISDIVVDSRKSAKGKMFVCIEGYTTDGHRFINDAVISGADALLVQHMPESKVPDNVTIIKTDDTRMAMAYLSDRLYDHPSGKLNMIGITGTKGKTTTSYMIREIYKKAGQKTGLIGTIQNMIGERILYADRTTPEANDLQRLLNDMVNENTDTCIMEASSQGLNLGRVAYCQYRTAIFTNLTRDHIGPSEHKDMDDYADAKSKLFKMATRSLLNGDSPYFTVMKKSAESTKSKIYTYGIDNEQSDFRAINIEKFSDHVKYDILLTEGTVLQLGTGLIKNIVVPIPGKFSVYNSLVAIACALLDNIDVSVILSAMSDVYVSGKAENVPTGRDFSILIDYAHNPDSFINIISTVKEYAKRTVFLFGCGGDRNRPRELMGKTVGENADFAIITSDNPRTEDPASIVKDLETGIKMTNGKYVCIVDRTEAIEYAIRNAKPGDVIILAGKGHETYQIFKDKTIHYDEREIVRDILKKLDGESNKE